MRAFLLPFSGYMDEREEGGGKGGDVRFDRWRLGGSRRCCACDGGGWGSSSLVASSQYI